MTFWSIAISAAAGIAIGLIMIYFKNRDYSNVYVISLKDFTESMRKGQLIDVRKKITNEDDKIKGSRHFIPRKATAKNAKLRKDLSVYLYCNNGKLSKRVAKRMSKKGFRNLYVLEKGYANYKENH